nr:hypothetical protein BaRGS_014679 [Batillaria attramentaria]
MTEDIPDPFACPTPCDINPRTDCESGTLIPRPVGTGCPDCMCKRCPGAVCPTSCPHGFGRVKLKNDCEKCFCKRPKGRKRFRYPYKK